LYTLEEKLIWQNIQTGDRQSLKNLHDKYFHQMLLFARKSVNDPLLAEELVSDCFIKIWENRSRIVIKVSVKSYLYLMLRNSIIDHYRHRQLATKSLGQIPEIAEEDVFDHFMQYAKLYAALEKLPQQRQKILELAVFDALTYDEIAGKLGITKNTVKTQIARAYRYLRETLGPGDFFLFLLFRKEQKKG
jgi:RNA polymerase sigma-70 factor (family 1)